MQISFTVKYGLAACLMFMITGLLSGQEQPRSFDVYYAKALAAEKQENYAEGIDILTQALNENPQPYYYIKRGDLFYARGRYTNALADYREAQNFDEDYALLQTAQCHARLGNIDALIDTMELYLKQRNKLPLTEIKTRPAFAAVSENKQWVKLINEKHYRIAESELDEAAYLIKVGKITQAYNIVSRRLEQTKRDARAYALRGDIFMTNQQYRKAKKDYTKAAEIDKKNMAYCLKKTEVFARQKDYKAVASEYDKILKLRPNAVYLYKEKAEAELPAGNISQAAEDMERYSEFFKLNAEDFYLLARIYKAGNDIFGALKAINKSLEIDKKNYRYFKTRGRIFTQTGMPEKAAQDYGMALDLHPSGDIYYLRALVRIDLGDIQGACHDLKMAEYYKFHKAADLRKKYCR